MMTPEQFVETFRDWFEKEAGSTARKTHSQMWRWLKERHADAQQLESGPVRPQGEPVEEQTERDQDLPEIDEPVVPDGPEAPEAPEELDDPRDLL